MRYLFISFILLSALIFVQGAEIVLQPGNDGQDTWVASWQPNTSMGNSDYLRTEHRANGEKAYTLLKFAVDEVSELHGVEIVRAWLVLRINNSLNGNENLAYEFKKDWREDATWGSLSITEADIGKFMSVGVEREKRLRFSLSPATVANWIAHPEDNHGIIIIHTQPVTSVDYWTEFFSSDYSDEELRPALEIEYYPPQLSVETIRPAGGERWSGGSRHNLVRRYDGGVPPLRFRSYYSRDGGQSWTLISMGEWEETGVTLYSLWRVPTVDSERVVIRSIVRDSVGSEAEDISEEFAIDSTPPRVVETSPRDEERDVDINQDITITFSEPMEPIKTQFAFYITPNPDEFEYLWDASKRVLTIRLAKFLHDQLYTASLTDEAQDASDPGNKLIPYSFQFTTEPYPLRLRLLKPQGGENLSGGSSSSIAWEIEGGKPSYRVTLSYRISPQSSYQQIASLSDVNPGYNAYPWLLPLVNSRQVEVRVEVWDTRGASISDTSTRFTIDSTPPQIIATQPRNTEVGVELTQPIIITFSEPMDRQSVIDAFNIEPAIFNPSYNWTEDSQQLTISHAGFELSKNYRWSISTIAKDASSPGNHLTQVWNFTFRSKTPAPLQVTLISPRGGERWSGNTLQVISWRAQGGVPPYTVELQYSSSSGQEYTQLALLTQPTAGVMDYNWTVGNIDTELARIRLKVKDSFNKEKIVESADFVLDATPPVLLEVSPQEGEEQFPLTQPIHLKFSEPVDKASFEQAFQISPTVTELRYEWTEDAREVKIIHSPFRENQVYIWSIAHGVKDISQPGNFLEPYELRFTTQPYPLAIQILTPSRDTCWSGKVNQVIKWSITGGRARYKVKLSYAFQPEEEFVEITELFQTARGEAEYQWLVPEINSDNVRLRIEVEDKLRQRSIVTTPSFTIDSTPPTIASTFPQDGAQEVPLEQEIVIQFSERVEPTSVIDALSVSPLLEGTAFTWEDNFRKLIINHSPFPYNTTYSLSLHTGVKDTSTPGNHLAQIYRWQFSSKSVTEVKLELLQPRGGSCYSGGSEFVISYRLSGGKNPYQVKILYSGNGGLDYTLLSEKEIETPGEYEQAWEIPVVNTTVAQIKLEVEDAFGGIVKVSSGNFSIDARPPEVISTIPENGASEIALSQPIVIVFSEPIAVETTSLGLIFQPSLQGVVYRWKEENKILTIFHEPFSYGERYLVRITERLKDCSYPGNAAQPFQFEFTAKQQPYFSLNYLAPGEGRYSGGSSQRISWKVAEGTPPYRINIYYLTSISDYHTITTLSQENHGEGSFIWQLPLVDVPEARLKITAQDAQDRLEEVFSPYFQIDASCPEVVFSQPENNSQDVSPTQPLILKFSEPMNHESVKRAFVFTPTTELDFIWDTQSQILTLSHSGLKQGQSYSLSLSSEASDISQPGNPLKEFRLNFSVEKGPPFLLSFVSPAGGENWTGGSEQEIKFILERGDAPYKTLLYYSVGDDSFNFIKKLEGVNNGEVSYSWQTPSLNAANVKIKVVAISSTGREEEVISQSFKLDSSKPEVVESQPEARETEVSLIKPFIITFNELIRADEPISTLITLEPEVGEVRAFLGEDRKSIVIHHQPLEFNTRYQLSLKPKIRDLSQPGNFIERVSFSFTTKAATPFSVVFSKPKAKTRWTADAQHTIVWKITGGEPPYILKLSSLFILQNLQRIVEIAEIVQNTAGKGNFLWNAPKVDTDEAYLLLEVRDHQNETGEVLSPVFILDATPPSVVATLPPPNAEKVLPGSSLQIEFSEPVEPNSAREGILLEPPLNNPIFYFSNSQKKLTIEHAGLKLGQVYTCFIKEKVKDTSLPGNKITPYTFKFTTLSRLEINRGKVFSFPNPVEVGKEITFTYFLAQETDKVIISLYNIVGKRVAQVIKELNNKQGQIETSVKLNLAPGVYFYTISTKTAGSRILKRLYTKKLTVIKRK
jgi:hypothetical protein